MSLKLIFRWGLIFMLFCGSFASQSTSGSGVQAPASSGSSTASATTPAASGSSSTSAKGTGSARSSADAKSSNASGRSSQAGRPQLAVQPSGKVGPDGVRALTIEPYCQQALLNSYGIRGLARPRNMTLGFCPHIRQSCCSVRDEMFIYENNILQGATQKLKNKLENFKTMFDDLIQAMLRVSKFAAVLKPTLKSTNNCKILADSIVNFKFETPAAGLKDLHTKYFDFHTRQFDGWTCTLCDAESSPFIDLVRKVVQLNPGACRATVGSSLPFLLYHHLHLPKLVNLMVNFASNCDARGDYSFQRLNEAKHRMTVRSRVSKLLNGCKNSVSKPNWLRKCSGICKRLSLVRLRRFFTPRIRKVQWITQLLNAKMQKIESQVALSAGASGKPAAAGAATTPTAPATTAPVAGKSTRLRDLRVLSGKRLSRRVKGRAYRRAQRRRMQSTPSSQKTVNALGSSQFYAAKILQDLKVSAFSTRVISPSVGAEIDLSSFATIIGDGNQNLPKETLELINWQIGALSEKSSSPPAAGAAVPPGYSPVATGGLNPQLVARFTFVTPAVFTTEKALLFKGQSAAAPASASAAQSEGFETSSITAEGSKRKDAPRLAVSLVAALALLCFVRLN